ncbi:HD-GYP domain-containing protein [Denitrobaculum tricleocarpae]|uniref:PAS domain S-box protein n=1 Tax=Denitrobaculum tricleocarpae TaxID=2591009 RepID=A0A545TWJ9_9PROT|nr:HD domain-containing phosphohydrolase [Denitrobaculum tricleocarpae]TQV81589.1 PAS domain S-box protein [Denitrobaculum tricleocarpae]
MMSKSNTLDALEGSATDPSLIDLEEPGSAPEASDALPKPALIGLVSIVILAVVIPWLVIESKKEQVIGDLQQRMTITVSARAEVISTWLDGTARLADRLVESELFRLFATDVDEAGGVIDPSPQSEDTQSTGLGIALLEQLPYMERVLTDFAISADFRAGYIVGKAGIAYVSSGGAPALRTEQSEIALDVLATGKRRFGPPQATAAGLVMDIYIPILPAASQTEEAQPVAVLIVAAPVATKLAESLAPRPLAPEGEKLHLVHKSAEGLVELLPTKIPEVQALDDSGAIPGSGNQAFVAGRSLDGETAVYARAALISGEGFWAVLEMNRASAHRELRNFATVVMVAAALVVFTVVAVFGAVWAKMRSNHNRLMAAQFKHLAARIQTQKRFLDSINSSIADYIGLKAADGSYRYANKAFAEAVGREPDEMIGLDDIALFGQGTADRLALTDQKAIEQGSVVTFNEEVYLNGVQRQLQFSKLPFHDEQDQVNGIVSVARDVTELVEEQAKRDRAVRQMVSALVRAIELRDPYLAGHSRRVASLSVAVAKRMQLAREDVATVEIAANLSQLGKLAISRKLLNKPERLNDQEIAEVRKHLDHAAEMLRDIDFELPVLPTIYQMHERLDGKGYPAGLTANKILMTAQILGICDVFAARVEPRSYRAGLSSEEAIKILGDNGNRYSSQIVAALDEVIGSVAGEKLMAGLPANAD